MRTPRISVVVPVFNVEKYIEKSILSIIRQSYKNFELIVVDDGSLDRSIDVAEALLQKSDLDYKIVHKENGGLGDARNYGFDRCDGDWIIYVDSDDMIQPDTLSLMANCIENNPSVQFVFSDFQNVCVGEEFREGGNLECVIEYNRDEIQKLFLDRKRIILAPGTLYNVKWCKKQNLRFEKVPYSEDQLFMWKALLMCDKVGYVGKKLYNYLQRPMSIMSGTKADKILDAYPYFVDLDRMYNQSSKSIKLTKKYLLSRWVLGILNSGSRLSTFLEYQNICETFEAKKHCKNLLNYPSIKIKILSALFLLSNKAYYKLMRKH